MKSRFRTMLIAASLAATGAISGPDETTEAFMDQSVSLLDWGSFRLETALNKGVRDQNMATRVWYDFDSNTIVVGNWDGTVVPEEEAREDCKFWFSAIRKWAGYSADGSLDGGNEISRFANFYGHDGYIRGDEDSNKELLMDLDKKFRLVAHRKIKSLVISSKEMKCSGTLYGSEVAITVE
ncbi:hypothetical protein [uncultured Shimia sp.]|uniref:hypothetical protein n=1 Tax=uncultured Shimia sp. TaxID=573152 RepID=UPI00263094C0|nr:hypothetical protein [uncultured Shimia sp.]